MKYLSFIVLAVILICSTGFSVETPKIEDEKDRVNYSIGYQIGGDLRRQGVEIQAELVLKGIQDAFSEKSPLMTPQEMHTVLIDLKKRIEKAEREKLTKDRIKTLAEGEAFLAENAGKDGVKVLPSGLQYRVRGFTQSNRYRNSPLSGYAYRWDRVRQLVQTKQAGQFSGRSRDPRMDRGPATDEGKRQVGALYSRQTGLRRTRGRHGDSPQQRPDFRGGTDFCQAGCCKRKKRLIPVRIGILQPDHLLAAGIFKRVIQTVYGNQMRIAQKMGQ